MPNTKSSTFAGKTFGRWTVIKFAFFKEFPCGDRKDYWICKCECGTVRPVLRAQLIRRHDKSSKSCGCLQRETVIKMNITHGMTGTTELETWKGIRARCYNPNKEQYKDYGGRGIKVCDAWRNSFSQFLADMGPKPHPEYTIERMNNDGDYEQGNCIWADRLHQGRNTRRIKRYTFNGESKTSAEWGEVLGIHKELIYKRVHRYRWTIERALTTPVNGKALMEKNS
jgi:hypothetical protein